jgi:predicted metal-dependent hydrolase
MARRIRTRRIEFDYPADDLPRHYMGGGDLVMSHVVTVLSCLFPEGEDFFVRTVRRYRDRITDPELRAQVAGFIGQEASHGHQHRLFNERLAKLGYPTRRIDRMTRMGLRLGERVLPASVNLATTAALEHYTATLAAVLLTDPEARAMFDVDEVRSMFLWHALEESEHKAVAFDVFQTVSGNHLVRVGVMNFVTMSFILTVVAHTAASVLGDHSSRDLRRVACSLGRLRRSPWLNRRVVRHIRAYNRRGFHPDDYDTTALVEEWRASLFGAGGPLADRMEELPARSA